ncbi:MAG TPA: acetyl-CoA carboxylase biotin carboxyl carrier protein [Burkholderiales bacterium]
MKPKAPTPAPQRDFTHDDLLQIVRLIEASARFSEVRLRTGDIEIEVRRAPATAGAPVPAQPAVPTTAAPAQSSVPAAQRDLEVPPGCELLRAPMVGTFYRAPLPGAAPFVEPGQRVAPDTVVGIVEVMKLMNSVEAGCAGTVEAVLVADGEAVEAGQPLLAIRAAP